jgi:hypothetical protein
MLNIKTDNVQQKFDQYSCLDNKNWEINNKFGINACLSVMKKSCNNCVAMEHKKTSKQWITLFCSTEEDCLILLNAGS